MAILTAFHLSFAIHYCSGQVASVSMFGHADGTCCCGGDDGGSDDAGRRHGDAEYLPDDGGVCCLDWLVALETDDFRTPSALVLSGPEIAAVPFMFLPARMLQPGGIFAAPDFQIIYPPGGFSPHGIDLLTQIHVLII
ncbi:MAG: hypothetical protein LBJ47_03745 [Tannerella sp.]|nr:hypothetical protein [Tannerella sp.]